MFKMKNPTQIIPQSSSKKDDMHVLLATHIYDVRHHISHTVFEIVPGVRYTKIVGKLSENPKSWVGGLKIVCVF